MRAHAVRQRSNAAQGEPAVEWRGYGAAEVLALARALEQVVVVFGDQRAADHVAVAADVFGGGLGHPVDTLLERALQDGPRDGAGTDADRVALARDAGTCP